MDIEWYVQSLGRRVPRRYGILWRIYDLERACNIWNCTCAQSKFSSKADKPTQRAVESWLVRLEVGSRTSQFHTLPPRVDQVLFHCLTSQGIVRVDYWNQAKCNNRRIHYGHTIATIAWFTCPQLYCHCFGTVRPIQTHFRCYCTSLQTLQVRIDAAFSIEVDRWKQVNGMIIPRATGGTRRACAITTIRIWHLHGKWKMKIRTESAEEGQLTLREMKLAHDRTGQIHDGMIKHTALHIYRMDKPAKGEETFNISKHYKHKRCIDAQDHFMIKCTNAPGTRKGSEQGWWIQTPSYNHINTMKNEKVIWKNKKKYLINWTSFAITNSKDYGPLT